MGYNIATRQPAANHGPTGRSRVNRATTPWQVHPPGGLPMTQPRRLLWSLGLAPDAIERFVMMERITAQGPGQPLVFVTTAKPYDKESILAAVDAKLQPGGDRPIFANGHDMALCFLDPNTIAYGPTEALQ